MSTVPADVSGNSDAELIASVRAGDTAAYGTLYERHVAAAYNLARQLAKSSAEADDLVSDAFAKVLDTLRAGKGPDSAFRAYLLTALRHTAYDKTRKDRRVDLNEDMADVGGPAAEALTVQFSDTAVAGLERTLAAKAFARLPERWQAVLWHTEIEQQSPADVAPILGLTANGVSALAYRAREGLRQAYLQVHLAETSAARCRATADRLGAWTRGGLAKRERAQVETHLDECTECRALAAELADVNGALRAVVAPIVLGGAVFGYLAAAGAAKASAATAGAAAVGAGAAAGAAGSSGGAGAAAGAAAAGPRQFLGVAASGVALAAAVAIGLAAGGGEQEIPAAAEQPAAPVAPPAPQPQPPAPPPQAPVVPPAPPQQPPDPPDVQPPPEEVPPPEEPAPQPEPEPDEPEPDEPPSLTATAPPQGIQLVPGEDPVDLPITVRNDGGSVSEPVSATLNLPEGVSAVERNNFAGGRLLRLDGPAPRQAQGGGTVDCPGSEGSSVTCRSEQGLEPGESVVLMFRLVASPEAKGGQVTGTVSAGSELRVSVRVPVAVRPAPDKVSLTVHEAWTPGFPWTKRPILKIAVRNDGQVAKPATIRVSEDAHVILGGWNVTCGGHGSLSCTSREPLEPGKRLHLWVGLDRKPTGKRDRTVTVSAELGSASASQTVRIECWGLMCRWPHPTEPPTPTTPAPPSLPTSTGPTGPTEPGKPTSTGPGRTPTGPPTAPTKTSAPTTTTTTESTPPKERPDKPGRPILPPLPWLPWEHWPK